MNDVGNRSVRSNDRATKNIRKPLLDEFTRTEISIIVTCPFLPLTSAVSPSKPNVEEWTTLSKATVTTGIRPAGAAISLHTAVKIGGFDPC